MTRFKVALAAVTVAVLLSGVPSVSAHHAVQASVDINNSVSAEGILVKVDWVNPHIWMHFDFTKPDGSVQKSVAVEGLGIAALRQVGITSRDALKIGQKFKINYYPFRSGQPGG